MSGLSYIYVSISIGQASNHLYGERITADQTSVCGGRRRGSIILLFRHTAALAPGGERAVMLAYIYYFGVIL